MPNTEWPSVIHTSTLREHAHIADGKIAEDLMFAELEIGNLEKVAAAYQVIAYHHPIEQDRREANFRAGVVLGEIDRRAKFVAFLRALQRAREAERAGQKD